MRHLVQHSPAFEDMQIVVHQDHVEVTHPEQWEFGFESLARKLAGSPDEEWPDLIEDHFIVLIAFAEPDPAELSNLADLQGPTEDVLPRTYVRLAAADSGVAEKAGYAEVVAPGLLWAFAFDGPEYISVMTDKHVRQHGFEQLWNAGLENLSRELPEDFMEVEGVYFGHGSVYVGSLPVILPWVIETVTGAAVEPHGALVSMPARNQFFFYAIRSSNAAGVDSAVHEMALLSGANYEDSGEERQLSPLVYWWSEATGFQAVAHHDETGAHRYFPDELQKVLSDLGVPQT
ncbi:hypothetical protein SAMN05216553_105344 [Lentzea fradiae]|uniref:Uncharacterized protein n=2 Tax=Lentzea fradiae TaxID=200378 RepID=A0A1G7RHT8_9PSEU|nr:hypothetical protein SAMN05216553_105344 [Lentzea fradiae]